MRELEQLIGARTRRLFLIVLAIAGSYRVLAGPSSGSYVRLREFTPPTNSVIDRKTILSAGLDYSIEDDHFARNTYFVHVLFNGPDGMTFNVGNRIQDGVEIRQKTGLVLVQYPVKRVWNDKYLAKPVTVRWTVMKRTGKLDSVIVAETDSVTYRLEP